MVVRRIFPGGGNIRIQEEDLSFTLFFVQLSICRGSEVKPQNTPYFINLPQFSRARGENAPITWTCEGPWFSHVNIFMEMYMGQRRLKAQSGAAIILTMLISKEHRWFCYHVWKIPWDSKFSLIYHQNHKKIKIKKVGLMLVLGCTFWRHSPKCIST